jgi:hypothetical protein
MRSLITHSRIHPFTHSPIHPFNMSFKYTKHTLKKIEDLLQAIDYTIRYEKGNFNSGYCIVENQRVAVVNKFFDTEARINCLLDILAEVEVEEESLDEKQQQFYKQLTRQQEK